MDFLQLTDIVKAAASGCPNWVTTLLGWRKDEKGSRSIEIHQFGANEEEGSDEEIFDKVRKIFNERWEESENPGVGSQGVEIKVPEVYDFLNDEILQNIDVNIDEMEAITLEMEKAPVEMDEEVAVATKLLGESFMPIDPQASTPKLQEIELDLNSVHSHPVDIAIPQVEQAITFKAESDNLYLYSGNLCATPKRYMSCSPMNPRSQARVIQFLDEENSNGDDDDEDEDTDQEQEQAGAKDSDAHQLKLKAPNFNLPTSEEDDVAPVNPYKSPAPLLPAAELEAGWSTPGPRISQTTTPLPKWMDVDVKGKAESTQSPSLFTPEPSPTPLRVDTRRRRKAESQQSPSLFTPEPSPSPQPSPSDRSPQLDVITTPVLEQYGVSFNTLYKLLLCTSCAEGFSLRALYNHLKKDGAKRMNWDSALECWRSTEVVFENHPSARLKGYKKFKDKIVESLISAGSIAKEEEIRSAKDSISWQNLPNPNFPGELPPPPIVGLRTFRDVIQCIVEVNGNDICGYITATKRTFHSHLSACHGRGYSEESRKVDAQTFNESWVKYFEVSSVAQLSTVDQTAKIIDISEFDLDAAHGLLHQTTATYMNDLNILPDTDIRTILPVFVETGIDQFLQPFNRKNFRKSYDPDPENEIYGILRRLILETYKNGIQFMEQKESIPSAIFLLMTNCTPGMSRIKPRRAFSPLTAKTSVASYALLELKFVWALLRARVKRKGRKQVYVFNKKQELALDNLQKTLDSKDDTDRQSSVHALESLFDEVYYPHNYETKINEFDMPTTAFLATQCVAADGTYLNIHLIPPIMAKLQYSIRLRSLRRILELRKSYPIDDDFFQKCEEFLQKYLQDLNLSPFATLRTMLHKMSVISKATPRPDMIWWRGDVVTVGEISVDIAKYKTFLQKKLNETEKFVEEHVLLDLFKLHELDDLCKISKLRDLPQAEDVLGNGILLDLRNNRFDNPQSAQLFLKMLQSGKLNMKLDPAGSIKFGQLAGLKWISNIDRALSETQSLCHTTQGPGVGRMTEQALQTPINTMNGSRNVIYENGEGTGAFRSGYHKGSFTTGKNKEILRLLPYRVFRLLYVLTRIIRPIELAALLDLLIPLDNRQATVTAYRERIWASYGRAWSPLFLSENLQRFMQRGMGVKMSARPYRHFAIAVQRHYDATSYGRYETDSKAKLFAMAADLMAGHSPEVAEMHYARPTDNVLKDPTLRAAYIRVCKDWHAFLGFSTSRDD